MRMKAVPGQDCPFYMLFYASKGERLAFCESYLVKICHGGASAKTSSELIAVSCSSTKQLSVLATSSRRLSDWRRYRACRKLLSRKERKRWKRWWQLLEWSSRVKFGVTCFKCNQQTTLGYITTTTNNCYS